MAKLTMSFMHPAAAAAAIVTCIVATAIVPSASARESPPPASTAPDSSANNSPSSPLAGPNTGAASNPAPSLVHRDFTGRVVRPETPIEVLALEGLGLSPADRARVDEISALLHLKARAAAALTNACLRAARVIWNWVVLCGSK